MTRRRVLLVEDDERSAALVQAAMATADLDIVRTASVAEARAQLLAGLPDAVLLDLRLPDEPGHVIAREIRAAPGGAEVVIFAISASVLEAHRREALESGCDGFIEKPISPRELIVQLQRGLQERVPATHDGR